MSRELAASSEEAAALMAAQPQRKTPHFRQSAEGYQSVVATTPEEEKKKVSPGLALSYGLVGAAMCSPVMMSFASIIFGDPFFLPYMPSLVKLALFSAALHQLCYVAASTLPFAVGQVQDAGLIFLSAMARKIVAASEEDAAITLAAALWTLGIATALLGLMLVLVGRLRLASLAQYLPVPVVGGYLGYIGFYCGQAGLAMMSGVEVTRLRDYEKLWTARATTRIAPGFGVALAIKLAFIASARYKASRTARALVIPAVLASTVVVFYAVLLATGSTLQEARDLGWVGQGAASSSSSEEDDEHSSSSPWALYLPTNAHNQVLWLVLRSLPKVAIVWIGMVLVVAFSSSLDVAAIEMELGRPLNYDAELQTVGLGNLISGLAGGFSGSYIFSQTILNLRSGVADRRSGVVVALAELALVFFVPVPPTALAPTCAFGGTLLVIAVELMDEWIVQARLKFSASEYAVDVFTFVAIHVLGLEAGFAAGLVAAGLAFAASSAGEGGAVALDPSPVTRSVVMRDLERRAFLSNAVRRGDLVVLQLKGFVFFGAAADLLAQFKKRLNLPETSAARVSSGDFSLYRRWRWTTGSKTAATATKRKKKAPRFVVLDCRDFAGVDATAARACFVPLLRLLRDAGISLYFAGLRSAVATTLTVHGVRLNPAATSQFPNLDAALEAAEDGLLRGEDSSPRRRRESLDAVLGREVDDQTLVAILSEYLFANTAEGSLPLQQPPVRSVRSASVDAEEDAQAETLAASAARLCAYFERDTLAAGTTLLAESVAPDRLFFIASGVVDFEYDISAGGDHHFSSYSSSFSASSSLARRRSTSFLDDDDDVEAAAAAVANHEATKKKRILRVTRGGVCGELNFFLRRPQRFACRVHEEAEVFILHRRDADRMRSEDPDLFILLQTGLLKNLCLQVEDSLGSALFSTST